MRLFIATISCLAIFTFIIYYVIYKHAVPGDTVLQVHSLCPSIYGHELVKASLLLGLFGGCQKHLDSGTHVPVRGDPHILIVGDPGLGKSQVCYRKTSCYLLMLYVYCYILYMSCLFISFAMPFLYYLCLNVKCYFNYFDVHYLI